MYPIEPRAVLRLGVLCVVGLLLALGIRSCPESPREDPAHDLLALDLAKRLHASTLAKDSLTKVAQQKKVVYVVAKATATNAVEHLPPAKIVGATLSLPEGDFVLPLPVVRYVGALQQTVALQANALEKADAALTASEQARAAGDSVSADLTLDRDRWKRSAESAKPSRWDGVKTWAIRIGIGVGAFKLGQSVH